MAVIGPIGTLLLCELSKVVLQKLDVDGCRFRFRFFFCVCFSSLIVGFLCFFFEVFFWYPMGGNVFFNVNNKRPVFLSAKVVFSCSESAGYSSGSIGFVFNWIGWLFFWKHSFLGVFQELVDPNFFPGTDQFEQETHGVLVLGALFGDIPKKKGLLDRSISSHRLAIYSIPIYFFTQDQSLGILAHRTSDPGFMEPKYKKRFVSVIGHPLLITFSNMTGFIGKNVIQ